ncbi:MAG: hypothetical protein ABJG42_23985 [Vibrio splendidus]
MKTSNANNLRPQPNYGKADRKKDNIRGHDAQLHSLVKNETRVSIVDITKEKFTGVITGYDAFTITLASLCSDTPITFFKGSLIRFQPEA